MMSQQAFLQKILAEPDDDAPRVIFADWLEEQGDPDRAAFIRVQCELARRGSDDDLYSDLQARERRLLVANAPRWCEDWFIGHRFRRGFLEALRCGSPAHLLDHAERLFREGPIREIWFDTQEDVWDPQETALLADSSYLARVRSLRLPPGRSFGVPTEALLALTASPHLTNLHTLDLGHGMCYSEIDDAIFAEMIGMGRRPPPTSFSALHRLGLNDAQIGDASVAALVASPLARTLTHLDLSDNRNISAMGILTLVSSDLWPRLTELDLSGVHTHPLGRGLPIEALGRSQLRRVALRADLDLLSSASFWGPIEALRLQCPGRLDGPELRRFLACPHLAQLTRLDLPDGGLTVEGASVLARCPHLTQLTALNLEGNRGLGDEGAQILAGARFFPCLTYLNLRGTSLTDEGFAALARRAPPSRLRNLDLSRTGVANDGLAALADSSSFGRLTTLNLEGFEGEPTEIGLLALANSPYLSCLTYLGLWSQQFPADGWKMLIEPARIAWPGLSWEAMHSDSERQAYKARFGWFEGRENLDWEEPFFDR